MKRFLCFAALILASHAGHAATKQQIVRAVEKAFADDARPRASAEERRARELNGWIILSQGDEKIINGGAGGPLSKIDHEREGQKLLDYGPEFGRFSFRDVWRWASVTKQVVAVLVMQEVSAGHIDLDRPIAHYLPSFAGPTGNRITVRQLLRHQSGLPDPDDTPKAKGGMPSYYTSNWTGSRDPAAGYCAGKPLANPGGNWRYNNCDYVVAGALLEAVTGKTWSQLVDERIAKPLGLRSLKAFPSRALVIPGYVGDDHEPLIDFTAFGAAAGLFGTPNDLWKFDRALMTGKLLAEPQRKVMWDGQPQLGSIALGQWVFEAPLKGCDKPVRIVERRGAIGGVQVRNFILPDNDIVLIVFANRDTFVFGEVWQGSGYSYTMLSAAACTK